MADAESSHRVSELLRELNSLENQLDTCRREVSVLELQRTHLLASVSMTTSQRTKALEDLADVLSSLPSAPSSLLYGEALQDQAAWIQDTAWNAATGGAYVQTNTTNIPASRMLHPNLTSINPLDQTSFSASHAHSQVKPNSIVALAPGSTSVVGSPSGPIVGSVMPRSTLAPPLLGPLPASFRPQQSQLIQTPPNLTPESQSSSYSSASSSSSSTSAYPSIPSPIVAIPPAQGLTQSFTSPGPGAPDSSLSDEPTFHQPQAVGMVEDATLGETLIHDQSAAILTSSQWAEDAIDSAAVFALRDPEKGIAVRCH